MILDVFGLVPFSICIFWLLHLAKQLLMHCNLVAQKLQRQKRSFPSFKQSCTPNECANESHNFCWLLFEHAEQFLMFLSSDPPVFWWVTTFCSVWKIRDILSEHFRASINAVNESLIASTFSFDPPWWCGQQRNLLSQLMRLFPTENWWRLSCTLFLADYNQQVLREVGAFDFCASL